MLIFVIDVTGDDGFGCCRVVWLTETDTFCLSAFNAGGVVCKVTCGAGAVSSLATLFWTVIVADGTVLSCGFGFIVSDGGLVVITTPPGNDVVVLGACELAQVDAEALLVTMVREVLVPDTELCDIR